MATAKTATSGARVATGTVTAVPSRAARSGSADPNLGATRSAIKVPTPASRTSASSSSDSSTSESDQRSENAGSLVVRLMNTNPWVRNAPATASRLRRRDTGRLVADGQPWAEEVALRVVAPADA